MGGSFVGLLVQRKVIHIEHGILGSSDMDQESGISAKFKSWLIAQVLYGMFQKRTLPAFFKKRLDQPKRVIKKSGIKPLKPLTTTKELFTTNFPCFTYVGLY